MVLKKIWIVVFLILVVYESGFTQEGFDKIQYETFTDPFDISPLHINSSKEDTIQLISEKIEICENQIKSIFMLENMEENSTYQGILFCKPIDFQQKGTDAALPRAFTVNLNGNIIDFKVKNGNVFIPKEQYYTSGVRYTDESIISFDLVLEQKGTYLLEISYENMYFLTEPTYTAQYFFSTDLAQSKDVSFSLEFKVMKYSSHYLKNIRIFSNQQGNYDEWKFLFNFTDKDLIPYNLIHIVKKTDDQWELSFSQNFFNLYSNKIQIVTSLYNFTDGYQYFIDDSSIYLMSNKDVTKEKLESFECIFFTKEQLKIARNAFYAKYGYPFKSKDLIEFFTNVYTYAGSAYVPNPDFSESLFNDVERANIETIKRLENMKLPAVIK